MFTIVIIITIIFFINLSIKVSAILNKLNDIEIMIASIETNFSDPKPNNNKYYEDND